MIVNIYCQYDRVSGIYSDIFPSVNDEVAVRSYREMILSQQPNVFNSFAQDKELYHIALFDDQVGELKGLKPKLVIRANDILGGFVNDENENVVGNDK